MGKGMGARAIKKPKRLLLTEDELKAQVRRANPLNDALFKYLFASEGNKKNLMRLLNDVLGPERRVVDVEYLDRGNDPRRNEGRASFLDVLACSEDGRIFHVEVQLLNEGYFFERVTYYSACSLADQLSRGEGYDSLRPVVFVSLLWFDLFPNRPEDWRSVHRIMDEEDHRCYSDLLEFQFFELSKLKRLLMSMRGNGAVHRHKRTEGLRFTVPTQHPGLNSPGGLVVCCAERQQRCCRSA